MKQKLYFFPLLFCLLFASTAAAQTENQTSRISEDEKKQVVDTVGRRPVDFYVYPDVARQTAAIISKNLDDGVTARLFRKSKRANSQKIILKIKYDF